MKKTKRVLRKKRILFMVGIIMLIGIFWTSMNTLSQQANALEEADFKSPKKVSIEKKAKFDEHTVKTTSAMIKAPFQNLNENNKLDKYETTEELNSDYFQSFADEVFARKFIEHFFYNSADGLFYNGNEIPHLIDYKRGFDIITIDENTRQVRQDIKKRTETDAEKVLVDYQYDELDDNWKIINITYQFAMY